MSQFPEIASNLSTANFRASVLTALQTIYSNAGSEQAPVVSGAITGTSSAGSTAYVVNTADISTLAFSTVPSAVSGITGTITIYASVDGVNYLQTSYVAMATGGTSSTFNAQTKTIGQINTVGLAYIAFQANAVTGGSVAITTVGTTSVSNVMLDNPIPAGTNVIGGVSVQDASGTLVMANGTANLTSAAVTSFSATKSLSIQNTSTYILYISTVSPASAVNSIVLSSGAIYRFPYVPTNQLYCLGTNAATTYNLWYA